MKEDCAICCESFTQLQFITCNYCEFKSCKTCTQRYIVESYNDPHCMNCKKTWSQEYMDSVFTKKFINNDLKKHRENILLEREKAMLPATQDACEREKTVRNIRKDVDVLYLQKRELQRQLSLLNNNIEESMRNIYAIRNGINHNQQRKQFVRKCPGENCRGFLSTQWKCGLCEFHVCKDCNEILTVPKDEHICDENSKATVSMLAKDTKPCPTCGTMIFRISGCSQMWCPDCHTSFCWNTGRIETGTIHNPHYYEWMRRNGEVQRNHGDQECGGLPNTQHISAYARFTKNKKVVDVYI